MSLHNDSEIIHNTLGDIIDNTSYYIFQEDNTLKEFSSKDDIVYSLDGLLFKTELVEELTEEYSYVKPIERSDYKLSRYLDKLPHGILDKRITGIGATTLEIKSKRNSIIVMPTKILAYNKSQQHPETKYIGSAVQRGGVVRFREEVKGYIEDESIVYKKFIVVADSLKKLIDYLSGKLEIDVYNEYFLMVDEIDLMQSDSNYRPSLEDVLDYYFWFNVKNRCLVSATMGIFSNPELEKECRFDISTITILPKAIELIHTDNIKQIVAEEVQKHIEKKVVVAFNSVSEAKNRVYIQ